MFFFLFNENTFYYFISFIFLISSFLVIYSINPIHSILSLILLFCSSAVFLLFFNVEFLALMFIIIYVGAISVLFLFVIMMLNIKLIEVNDNLIKYLPISLFIFLIFIFDFYLIFSNTLLNILDYNKIIYIQWISILFKKSNIESLGILLFTDFFFIFLLSSLILFVSMVGPIVLTLITEKKNKKQNIYEQINQKYNLNLRKNA
jgi:NADH-quinone oxidoreductase subunit J